MGWRFIPNCGTNLVTTGTMTTVAAMIGLSGASRREAWNRLPTVLLLVMGALLFSQPIGLSLQKYITTDGDPADLESSASPAARCKLRLAPIR